MAQINLSAVVTLSSNTSANPDLPATTEREAPSFNFPALPSELRHMIWQLAMPAPSMLRFTVSKYSSDAEDLSGDRFEFESPILTPLLHTVP
jgi:hypothetical protein